MGASRGFLLLLALCCGLLLPHSVWALSDSSGNGSIALPQIQPLANSGFMLPTLYESSAKQGELLKDSPILGRLQFAVGGQRKLSLNVFSYGGRTGLTTQTLTKMLGLTGNGTAIDELTGMPNLVPRTALQATRTLDDQATSFKTQYDTGKAKLSVEAVSVGQKFAEAAKSLTGVDQTDLQALVQAAGTHAFNLSGAYQFSPNMSLTSTRRTLTNEKTGDDNFGLTSTDWVNALALNLGKSTTLKMALTDHDESWAHSTGKSGLSRQIMEFSGESKFGTGGKYGLRFGLTNTDTNASGSSVSESAREIHLDLPVAARLKLNADYTSKTTSTGTSQSTNLVTAVMQLYSGAELTARLKNAMANGVDTHETYLKLTDTLGHGGSTLKLQAEQTDTHAVDASGMLHLLNVNMDGGLGKGGGRLGLRATLQDKRGEGDAGVLERLLTAHLERGFGPHLSLTVDHEEKQNGTLATYEGYDKSVLALALQLAPKTKVTAGLTTQTDAGSAGTGSDTWSQDLTLAHQLGAVQVKAETHRGQDASGPQAMTAIGADWAKGKLPEWANNLTRRHEFDDIYDYKVTKEAAWLDLPFAGTRLWAKQRSGGLDDGARSLLFSHRMMLTKHYHLQLTYQDRPEFEDGDNKGRPQAVRREYVELGTPVSQALVGRAWLCREEKPDDPLSQRHTLGLGVTGKLATKAQMEVNYSHQSGAWEGASAARQALALLYSRRVDGERNVSVKAGYAWGEQIATGKHQECRVTVAYANPM